MAAKTPLQFCTAVKYSSKEPLLTLKRIAIKHNTLFPRMKPSQRKNALKQQDKKKSNVDKFSDKKRNNRPLEKVSNPVHQKHPNKRLRTDDIRASANPTSRVLPDDIAAALRRDDEEIQALEMKLGLSKRSKHATSKNTPTNRTKLHKEYAKLEGYGQDFGEFLDSLDNVIDSILEQNPDHANSIHESEEEEEELPTQPADFSIASSSNQEPEEQEYEDEEEEGEVDEDEEQEEDEDEEDEETVHQVDEEHTYKPLPGTDLYGNIIDSSQFNPENTTNKYIPPHLRQQGTQPKSCTTLQQDTLSSSTLLTNEPPTQQTNTETLKLLRRLLNNHLNRLSDNTLESVIKSIASLYSSHPCQDVNSLLYENIQQICIAPHLVMTKLIPVYMACIAGIHFYQNSSSVSLQCGTHMVEAVVLRLLEELNQGRTLPSPLDRHSLDDNNTPMAYKKYGPNLTLMLCYLYNFQVLHCALIYDVIRDLISHFTEIDIDMILLIASHAGFQLRSDDPTALKEIILSVKQRADCTPTTGSALHQQRNQNSRVQSMIAAIADLKNNKRKSGDVEISDKISHYRKILGRMKSLSYHTMNSSSGATPLCLRVSLSDIKNVETRGRWWSVGSSWSGNQLKQDVSMDDAGQSKTVAQSHSVKEKAKGHDPNDKLLALATKNRMNSDVRRAIFCILMGSQDYEDAFMKLLKANLLENDVVRVLTDCCAREQVYNPFYSLLGGRLCEYSSSMKFTFQLAFWDMFNHFNDCNPNELKKKDIRLSNNLAKLLAHLLKSECLKLSVLRRLDITRSSISEPTAVFLTVLFTDLFETMSDSSRLVLLMSKGLTISSNNRTNDSQVDGEDAMLETDWSATFKESLSAFFMKYLQSSPKNIKSSVFERNLKAALKMCDHDDLSHYKIVKSDFQMPHEVD